MATAAQLVPSLGSLDRGVAAWVDEVARLSQPDRIHWCDGSATEYQSLERELVAKRDLLPLNPVSFPGCHLHRSHPSDVSDADGSRESSPD
jgi:phosphoenolpyruvate carboxykinase (GTP)